MNELKQRASEYAENNLKIYSNLYFSHDKVFTLMVGAYERGWNDCYKQDLHDIDYALCEFFKNGDCILDNKRCEYNRVCFRPKIEEKE